MSRTAETAFDDAPATARRVPRLALRPETWTAALLATVATLALRPIADPDLWASLATGRALLDGGGRLAPGWLAAVALAAVERAGEPSALVALSAALAATTALVVVHTCRAAGARPGVAVAAVALGALSAAPRWDVGPHLFSVLCLALVSRCLTDLRTRGVDRLWALVPVMALWANTDVLFPLGGLLVAVDVARHPQDWHRPARLALAAALVLVVVATPGGYHLATPSGPAFETPSLHATPGLVLTLLFFATTLAMIASPLPPDGAETARVLLFAAFAYGMALHLPCFAVVAAPVLARHVDALLPRSAPTRASGFAATAAHVALVVVACLGLARQAAIVRDPAVAIAVTLPSDATRFVARWAEGGRVLAPAGWSGFVLDALGPRWTPCFDDAGAHRELAAIGPEWRALLDRCAPAVVVWPRDRGLANVLALLPEWQAVHVDAVATVFARSETRP